jgi:hypothetical protein
MYSYPLKTEVTVITTVGTRFFVDEALHFEFMNGSQNHRTRLARVSIGFGRFVPNSEPVWKLRHAAGLTHKVPGARMSENIGGNTSPAILLDPPAMRPPRSTARPMRER